MTTEAQRLAYELSSDYCPDWFNESGVKEVVAELRRLDAENEAHRKDVERYRWLRANWFTMGCWYLDGKVKFTTGEPRWSDQPESNIDAAIDAAIAAKKGNP